MGSTITSRFNADGTLRTAEEWRRMAHEARRRSADSFERCDTDGFMSQWASDTVAREYDSWADLAENGYRGEFTALFDVAGNLVDADYREGQYGWYWLVKLPNGGVEFFRESNAKKGARRYATDTAKGYRVGSVRREAYVKLTGGSYMSVGPALYPVHGSESTVVDDATDQATAAWYADRDY